MFLEIAAEEAGIGKMIFPRHLLDALGGALELHLQLEHHILVDDDFGCMPRYLSHDIRKILGGDVHLLGIIVDISRLLVIAFHEHHEAVEEFPHPVRFHLVGTVLRIALQIFVEPYEEGLELIEYQLRDAGTVVLLEIESEERKHALDDMGNHGRILPASVLAQGRINRLFQLQTGFAQQRWIIFQHLHFEGRSIHSGTSIPLAGSEKTPSSSPLPHHSETG